MANSLICFFSILQKLKLTTYYAVSKTCDELGKDNTLLGPFTVSKDAKELITEFIMNKMELYAEDLEAFARFVFVIFFFKVSSFLN